MRWITAGGPEPIAPGWYPTISRWDAQSIYVPGAHRWMGSDWICIEPECVTCYYLEVFDNAHEARVRAQEMEARIGLAAALDDLPDLSFDAGETFDPNRPGWLGWLGEARRRLGGSTVPPR
jgi:hypothetical protein